MHRVIRDHLEEVFEKSPVGECDGQVVIHLNECEECRGEVDAMLAQARFLRSLRANAEPRPGFYARVLDRIEKEGAASIWNVFSESPFGRRIAVASMVLVVFAGIALYTSEAQPAGDVSTRATVQFVAGQTSDDPGDAVLMQSEVPDRDSVLVNLVTYREQ